MSTYNKVKLHGTISGNVPKLISGTTVIHQTEFSDIIYDDLWLWVAGQGGAGGLVSITISNAIGSSGTFYFSVPEYSSALIFAGYPMSGTGDSPTLVSASVVTGGPLMFFGYAERMQP